MVYQCLGTMDLIMQVIMMKQNVFRIDACHVDYVYIIWITSWL